MSPIRGRIFVTLSAISKANLPTTPHCKVEATLWAAIGQAQLEKEFQIAEELLSVLDLMGARSGQ
jgi:hypothetical protein